MIALITGINGFVGPYLREELESSGILVYGLDITGDGKKIFQCDITDSDSVQSVISRIRPDLVFHLAGFSSVAKSFENPELCFRINVDGTKNLLDAIIMARINPRILIISSSEVYGRPEYNPIDENHPLKPVSPYGESRQNQEILCMDYIKRHDLKIIISRSFNHTGPNQSETFVIPSFRKQILEAKDGDEILVGNLDIIRDFSDVRDVVKAYRALLESGEIGEVYNIGSGHAYHLGKVLKKMILESGKKLSVKIDPKRYRKADIEEMVCNPKKLMQVIDIKFRKII
jgi:GDP-4-dehydro-6-deoxy-D-mannose reductase